MTNKKKLASREKVNRMLTFMKGRKRMKEPRQVNSF
jgi:hypothetical protein